LVGSHTLHMLVRFIPACLSVSQKPLSLNSLSKHIALSKYKRGIRRCCLKRPQILPSTSGDAGGLRVFVLSDLHTDYAENMKLVKSMSTVRHKKDVLLVAGDVAETYENFVLTMSLLKDGFEHVFYVPGNHDLWCRDGQDNVRNIISLLGLLHPLYSAVSVIFKYLIAQNVLGLYMSAFVCVSLHVHMNTHLAIYQVINVFVIY
jgi:hypothetical protein